MRPNQKFNVPKKRGSTYRLSLHSSPGSVDGITVFRSCVMLAVCRPRANYWPSIVSLTSLGPVWVVLERTQHRIFLFMVIVQHGCRLGVTRDVYVRAVSSIATRTRDNATTRHHVRQSTTKFAPTICEKTKVISSQCRNSRLRKQSEKIGSVSLSSVSSLVQGPC